MAKGNLTQNQQKALEVLITNGNVSQAAEAAGVTRQTIYTWKQENKAFQSALEQESAEVVNQLTLRLANLGDQAIQTLQNILEDPNTPGYVRIRAADIIISKLLQLRESKIIERRLVFDERKYDESKEEAVKGERTVVVLGGMKRPEMGIEN
jgi:uncharacterized protein (UPF0147 family)